MVTSPSTLPFSLEDDTVPEPLPVDEIKSAVGIDVGLAGLKQISV
jgi:hypothetical protein